MNFTELGLAAPLLEALSSAGYEQPTDVQAAAIPAAIAGSDLLVSSRTGSGKTAAFVLPSLQRLQDAPKHPGKGPRILVLAPTRELALQVNNAARQYARGLRRFTSITLVGGAPYEPQIRALSRPVDLVVATPGRLLDHLQAGRMDFSRLETLVLDEADRMLDMGFLGDIEQIVARTPSDRQTLMFSATLDGIVGDLARRLTRSPQRIDIVASSSEKADIDQVLMYADDMAHKTRLLDALLRNTELKQCVVFAATRRSTEELTEQLTISGFSAAALHGDMHQGQRNRTLRGLRDGHTQILVATDVAARGIDVAGISHVINFDAPRGAEDYVHRIGRTGRAGRTGVAVTLLRHDEAYRARVIERFTGQPLRIDEIAGLEPRKRATSAPSRNGARPGSRWAGKPAGKWQGQPGARPATGAPASRSGRPGAWRAAEAGNGASGRQPASGWQPGSSRNPGAGREGWRPARPEGGFARRGPRD